MCIFLEPWPHKQNQPAGFRDTTLTSLSVQNLEGCILLERQTLPLSSENVFQFCVPMHMGELCWAGQLCWWNEGGGSLVQAVGRRRPNQYHGIADRGDPWCFVTGVRVCMVISSFIWHVHTRSTLLLLPDILNLSLMKVIHAQPPKCWPDGDETNCRLG